MTSDLGHSNVASRATTRVRRRANWAVVGGLAAGAFGLLPLAALGADSGTLPQSGPLRGALAVGCAQPTLCPGADGASENAATRLDWQFGTRGTYLMRNGLGLWQSEFLPQASVETRWLGGSAQWSVNAGLVARDDGKVIVNSATANGRISHRLALDLKGEILAKLSVLRDAETTTVTDPAYQLQGSLDAGIEKKSGRLTLSAAALLGRDIWSDTGKQDGSWTSNTYQNRTGLGVRGGAKLALTPILTVSAEGRSEQFWYDQADPATGVFRNGLRHELRGGLSGNWPLGLKASVYTGYVWRTFESPAMQADGALIYGGSLDYALADGGKLSASYETSFTAPVTQGTATSRIDQTVSAGIAYPLSPVLSARANAALTATRYPGSWQTGIAYGGGAGLDWKLARNLSLAADYGYNFSQTSTQLLETHRFSAGMTVSR